MFSIDGHTFSELCGCFDKIQDGHKLYQDDDEVPPIEYFQLAEGQKKKAWTIPCTELGLHLNMYIDWVSKDYVTHENLPVSGTESEFPSNTGRT